MKSKPKFSTASLVRGMIAFADSFFNLLLEIPRIFDGFEFQSLTNVSKYFKKQLWNSLRTCGRKENI